MARGKAAEDEGHVALLRGINVGGKNRLPMQELAALLTAAGGRDVRTYIQSGNAVFRAPATRAPDIAHSTEQAIIARFGFEARVIVRRASELLEAARKNPYLEQGVDSALLHLVFLADRPSAAALAKLDPKRSPPDTFVVAGREIYLFCPDGFGRTKLTNAYFDARLGTTSTVRNWRTVMTLVEMSG